MEKILIPKSFDDFFFHKNLVQRLKNFNEKNICNILFYGAENSGKKTLVKHLLNHIFKTDVFKQQRIENYDIKIGNNPVSLEYIVSPYHYEINLYEYGFYDKNVITDFIYKLLEYENIIIGRYKFIIINHFEKLTETAQMCLRRIIEKTINVGRFICISNTTSSLHDAITSRLTMIRVAKPNKKILREYLKYNLKKFSLPSTEVKLDEIISKSNNDIYRLNLIIEYFIFNKSIDNYPWNNDISHITRIVTLIEQKNLKSIYEIRDIVYKALLVNISSLELISEITQYYYKKKNMSMLFKTKLINLSSNASLYANMIEYDIIAIEWFELNLKKLLLNNN